jgi:hypothetical protein
MAWTEEQKEYAQRVSIATLIGGLAGGLVGQFASKPATMGKTALGVALGAGVVGAGYGLYLRSGGAPGAEFAGFMGRLGALHGGHFPHMRTTMARLSGAGCSGCGSGNKMSGYEVERRKTLGAIQAFRGTYEVSPGNCWEG